MTSGTNHRSGCSKLLLSKSGVAFRLLPVFFQDLRYALRRLRNSLGFTATAVIIMGLGIGANTAIFSIINGIFVHPPLPYRNPSETVRIYTLEPNSTRPSSISYPDYLDYRDRSDLFSAAAASNDGIFLNVLTKDVSETFVGEAFSAELFLILNASPHLGRAFRPEEDLPGSDPVVIISYEAFQRWHGGDPDILGKTLRINSHPVTVVGIGPRGFSGTLGIISSDYWLSWGTAALVDPQHTPLEDRGFRDFYMFGRLKPGVSIEQAQAGLSTLAANLAREYPDTNRDRRVSVLRATDIQIDPVLDRAILPISAFLLIVVGLVLMVACSNLAGLLLTRASVMQKEIAVRIALGASRGRLVGQLLTESALLGVLGGIVGLVLAYAMATALVSFKAPLPIVLTIDFKLDATVLAYTLLLSILTGIIFGLTPALKASRCDLAGIIKNEAELSAIGRKRFALRDFFVVVQVAVSLLLLIGAGLFIRSLGYSQRVELGFESERTAIAAMDVSLGGYTDESAGRAFLNQYKERIASLPGVVSVALANRVPFGIWGIDKIPIRLPGVLLEADSALPQVDFCIVTEEYFNVMDVPVVKGRNFDPNDVSSSPPVVIISKTMAEHFLGPGDVIGQKILLGRTGEPATIVGVARDTVVKSPRESPLPYLYVPFSQKYSPQIVVVVSTHGKPAGLPELFRRELRALDRNVPLFEAKTMEEHLRILTYGSRMTAIFLSAFGILTLVLASVGLYGLVAFSTLQRTREIGIRIALGASKQQVMGMVLRKGIGLTAVGLAFGLPIAVFIMQPLSRMLVDVSTTDPITFAAVALLLLGVAILASLLPARRAANTNPMKALRYD